MTSSTVRYSGALTPKPLAPRVAHETRRPHKHPGTVGNVCGQAQPAQRMCGKGRRRCERAPLRASAAPRAEAASLSCNPCRLQSAAFRRGSYELRRGRRLGCTRCHHSVVVRVRALCASHASSRCTCAGGSHFEKSTDSEILDAIITVQWQPGRGPVVRGDVCHAHWHNLYSARL